MALTPTKKISALAPVTVPLTGFEELECVQLGNSRKLTTRDLVLPTDSLLTLSAMGGSLPGSRQMIAGIGIAFIDGGPGSTLSINATGAVAGPANPTALVGLTPVNGAAITYMRSDAAPALDQGIAPTWTGNHIFAANQNQVVNALPQWIFTESDAAADNRTWPIRISSEQFTIGALNDLGSVFTPWVAVDRTGTTIDLVNLTGTTVSVNGQNIRDAAILLSGVIATPRLGSGVADATTWLRGDQTWQVLPGSFSGFANPTASIGLVAINGVATTAMRSDAAPALNQAIVPTWTGKHIFTGAAVASLNGYGINLNSAAPGIQFNESDAAANNRLWSLLVSSEQLSFRVDDDTFSVSSNWMVVDRTGVTIDSIALTSTALTWNGNPISTAVGANPTASLGLTAVNGVATTFMRSDAAPALSQSIAPTWTGIHTFSNTGGAILLSSASPILRWNESDAAADNRLWDVIANAEQLSFRAVNDAVSATGTFMSVDRTGTTVDGVTFPAQVVINNSAAPLNEKNTIIRVLSTGGLTISTATDAAPLTPVNSALSIAQTGTTVDFVVVSSSEGFFTSVPTVSFYPITCRNLAAAGDNFFAAFQTEPSPVIRGSITYNRGAGLVAYNTTSDARRKKNIRDSEEASPVIDSIRVRSFEWIESDAHLEYWLVAQELAEVFPPAVSIGSANQDWAIDTSKLIPLMIKEIQSLRARANRVESIPSIAAQLNS